MPVQAAPSLETVLGQDRAVDALRTAAGSRRLHHAWIFAGPAGVGKRLTAEAFAALILDPTTAPNLAGQLGPDPESATQRMIASGTHPDLHIITKELARFADDKRIRESKLITIAKDVVEVHLLEPIALAPTIASDALATKVFIIDEAELLDRSLTDAPVQNSILKTLEEPAPGSVIILVTSAEDRLLPTIRSRCQRVVFHALGKRAMDAWMDRELPDVTDEERRWLAGFAQGSPGRALLAHTMGLHHWADTIEPLLARVDRGEASPVLGATLSKLVSGWAERWVKEHAGASKESATHAGAAHLLSMLAARSHDSLRRAAREGDSHAQAQAVRWIDLIGAADRHVRANVNVAHAMENLAGQLALA